MHGTHASPLVGTAGGASSYNLVNTVVTTKAGTANQAGGSIVQNWVQYRDWDTQSTADVPSYLNLVCNHSITANGGNGSSVGSCGSATLASKASGVYTTIKGQTSANLTTCQTSGLTAFTKTSYTLVDGDAGAQAVC